MTHWKARRYSVPGLLSYFTSTLSNCRLQFKLLWVICIVLPYAGVQTNGAFCLADDRPNILLIVSEDNGQELGCYGDPFVKTPHLDRLANEGVRFHNAYVPQSGCSQSRAAYFTGLYPHQNGQIGLATWKYQMYREDTPNMVRALKDAGYRTGLIGKLHVNPKSAFPFDMTEINTSNFSRKELDRYVDYASKFFQSDAGPFFLSVNYPDAHRPLLDQVSGLPSAPLAGSDVKPLEYFGLDTPELRSDTASYYNCMNRLDSLIGDLLDALERSGKARDTLVVYIGDHGADLFRGKRTSYEGGVRVPMIVRWTGQIRPTVQHALVSTLDLFPTLLEIARLEQVENLAGMPLNPLLGLQGRKPTREALQFEWRRYLFTEYHLHSAHNFYPQRTVRNERFKLIENLLPGQENPGYAFTINRFFEGLQDAINDAPEIVREAYDRMKVPPQFELYDLQEDPYEFANLAGNPEYRSHFEELKSELRRWREKTKDPLLDPQNLRSLKSEVDACFEGGKPEKSRLKNEYVDYFFRR